MAARTPRRTFANPFVLTLAAIPAACIATSNPPPPNQRPQTADRDHRNEDWAQQPPVTHTNPPGPHSNPPPPQPEPQPQPMVNPPRPTEPATNATNTHVTDAAQPTSAGMAQEPPRSKDRWWTYSRSGKHCEAMVEVICPDGASCNPPPPTNVACPKVLADGESIKVVQRGGTGDCMVHFGVTTCPPNTKCNPPRPQKVVCPK